MLSDKDVTSSESIVGAINSAKDDDRIKGVLIEIDSAGGLPVAGEEIANALKSLGKPSAAVIRQTGTSAAYWAATGADKIFASKNSDVGSIGVTMSYTENISTSSKYIQLSTGKYKDAGDPNKPLTQDERNMFMHDLEIVHKNFVKDVSQNRGLQEDKVKAIADGSSILGEKALELKLIDGIGSWTQAEDYLKEKIGEKPEICWQ
jgi:protease-4